MTTRAHVYTRSSLPVDEHLPRFAYTDPGFFLLFPPRIPGCARPTAGIHREVADVACPARDRDKGVIVDGWDEDEGRKSKVARVEPV